MLQHVRRKNEAYRPAIVNLIALYWFYFVKISHIQTRDKIPTVPDVNCHGNSFLQHWLKKSGNFDTYFGILTDDNSCVRPTVWGKY